MTTQQMTDNMTVRFHGYGTFLVTINYRNKKYSCTTNNTLAIDRMNERYEIPDRKKNFVGTYGEAVRALWEECKQKNGLGQYKY